MISRLDYLNHPASPDFDLTKDLNWNPLKPETQMNSTAMETDGPDETPAESALHKQSGGEMPADQREEYIRLRDLIKRGDDVFDVIALSRRCDGTWLYFIKTPFVSFPKFVIGETTTDNANPTPLFRSGARWSADAKWDELRHGKGQDA